MKLVRVEIPFREIAKNKVHKTGAKVKLPDETVEKLRSINHNIVTVLEDIPEDGPKEASKDTPKETPEDDPKETSEE